MAKRCKKTANQKVPFETWFLMVSESVDDIDFDKEPITLAEFLEKLETHLKE